MKAIYSTLVLLSLVLLIGCGSSQTFEEPNQSNEEQELIYEEEVEVTPEITFYGRQCLNNYYEYIDEKDAISEITGADDNYYYYIDYYNERTDTIEHAIFPKCTFVEPITHFSNTLTSLEYPCCAQNAIVRIADKMSVRTVREAMKYLLEVNGVEEYTIKSMSETTIAYFVTVEIDHTIVQDEKSVRKEGLVNFRIDKDTGELYETKARLELTRKDTLVKRKLVKLD